MHGRQWQHSWQPPSSTEDEAEPDSLSLSPPVFSLTPNHALPAAQPAQPTWQSTTKHESSLFLSYASKENQPNYSHTLTHTDSALTAQPSVIASVTATVGASNRYHYPAYRAPVALNAPAPAPAPASWSGGFDPLGENVNPFADSDTAARSWQRSPPHSGDRQDNVPPPPTKPRVASCFTLPPTHSPICPQTLGPSSPPLLEPLPSRSRSLNFRDDPNQTNHRKHSNYASQDYQQYSDTRRSASFGRVTSGHDPVIVYDDDDRNPFESNADYSRVSNSSSGYDRTQQQINDCRDERIPPPPSCMPADPPAAAAPCDYPNPFAFYPTNVSQRRDGRYYDEQIPLPPPTRRHELSHEDEFLIPPPPKPESVPSNVHKPRFAYQQEPKYEMLPPPPAQSVPLTPLPAQLSFANMHKIERLEPPPNPSRYTEPVLPPKTSKLKLKEKKEEKNAVSKNQMKMDKFLQPSPQKSSSASLAEVHRRHSNVTDDSGVEFQGHSKLRKRGRPKKSPEEKIPARSKSKPKKKQRRAMSSDSDNGEEANSAEVPNDFEDADIVPPFQPLSKSTSTVNDTVGGIDQYASQSAFNRDILTELHNSQHCDIQHEVHIRQFWTLCRTAALVVIGTIWIDGSTNFRAPTKKQEQLFRKFVRQLKAKATPKECEEREKRVLGSTKIIAFVFHFFADNQDTTSPYQYERVGAFYLPVCPEGEPLRAIQHDAKHPTLCHPREDAQLTVRSDQLRACFTAMLQLETLFKLFFNAKDTLCAWLYYSRTFQLPCGEQPMRSIIDAQIAAWMLDPDDHRKTNLYLLPLLAQYCRHQSSYPIESLEPTEAARLVVKSLVADCKDLTLLWVQLRHELTASRLDVAYHQQEMSLMPILTEIQSHGVYFDGVTFQQSAKILEIKMVQLNNRMAELSGEHFLVTSPAQVSDVLFNKMKFKVVNQGNRGRGQSKAKIHASTDESVIQQLISLEQDPDRKQFLLCISEYRKLAKIKSTYMEPMQAAAESMSHSATTTHNNAPPKAIFCQWNQCAVGTGRLSTSMPNLQSLPRSAHQIEDDNGGDFDDSDDSDDSDTDRTDKRVLHEINIRGCFRPSHSEKLFLSADFNQMEMRILAHFSGDRALRDFFSSGGTADVYRFMAALCFDIKEDEVTSQQRAAAKTLSLGISYGMGAENMAMKLTKFTGQTYSKTSAQSLIDRWYQRMHGVKLFMAACRSRARTEKVVWTQAHRLRRLPGIASANKQEAAYAERQSVNSVIQGTASDLCKRAMILLHDKLVALEGNELGDIASLCLQLHDEIVIEVHQQWLHHVADIVKQEMETVFFEAQIPFPVNLKVGSALGQLKPYNALGGDGAITADNRDRSAAAIVPNVWLGHDNATAGARSATTTMDSNSATVAASTKSRASAGVWHHRTPTGNCQRLVSQSSLSFTPPSLLSTPASASSLASTPASQDSLRSEYEPYSQSSIPAYL